MTLFAFFGLWETTLLAAAGGVSVPVIIHLLNRRRFKIVTWAAMRFLLAAQRQNTRRMRLEQILLLLVRMALVLLVVLAMASIMPWAENVWAYFWPEGGAVVNNRASRVHHVIVLDGSLSMNLSADGGTCFERARQLALRKVKDANPGDGFSVLLMKENPVWIVGETSQDARKVARELEDVFATHGNASVPAMLNMVAGKLGDNAKRFPTQVVSFFTDLQRATWANVPAIEAPAENKEGKEKNILAEIAQRAQLAFIDVGREGVPNLAVTDLIIDEPFITTGAEVQITAMVQNYGSDLRKNLRAELWTGRAKDAGNDPPLSLRVVSQELRDVAAGERIATSFTHRFSSPGTYAVQVKLESDELDVDDVRTVVVTVKETIPVLLINGKPSPDRFDQATEYLRIALNPFPKGAEPKFAPLRPRVVSVPQFSEMPENELLEYDCLFFCDVGQLGALDVRRLETFLRLGGGAIFAVGDQVTENLEAYNRLLYKNGQGTLPAKLVQRMQDQFTLAAQEDAYRLPPLKVFDDQRDRLGLNTVRFRQYLAAEAAQDPKVRTILSYLREEKAEKEGEETRFVATNHPVLLEWNPPLPRTEVGDAPRPREVRKGPATPLRYRGKVILLTSTVNTDWNSWPGSPSYGAMMQELSRLGVSGKLLENSLLVGHPLEEVFASGGLDVDAFVVTPDPKDQARIRAQADGNAEALKQLGAPRKVRTQSQGQVSVFRWTETDLSGIYTVTTKADPREHVFAVNFPASTADQRDPESDLSRLSRDRLKELYAGWDLQVVTDPAQIQITPVGNGDDIMETRGKIGPSIAHMLLLGVLVLLFIEVVLAWQFGHYSAVEGATTQPATSLVGPLAVGSLAVVVFAGLAFILYDAYRTGDFLNFLPQAGRAWIEQSLGVPPAPAGEGTRWDLAFSPYFRDAATDPWLAGFLALGAIVLLIIIYRAEAPLVHPVYKLLLGGLRIFLILFTLAVLLPQLELRFDRQGWPDIVLLIDDSRSMGEPDQFQDEAVRERARILGEQVRKLVKENLPAKMQALELELSRKQAKLAESDDPLLKQEVDLLAARLQTWQEQLTQANSPTWRPTRLQLAQALLAQPEQDWLQHLVHHRHTKVHIYHLDAAGRAIPLTLPGVQNAGEVTDAADPQQLQRAQEGIAQLEAEGKDSRLGTAVRQVIDQYRGASLSAVIMFTDGVTTRDESIGQASEYAAQKGIPMFFVGVGDDHEVRDLRLHDLQVEDVVYVNDRVVFEARLTGHGYKDLTVPVVLKVKEKDGTEKELAREPVKVDPQGKSVKVRLRHQPTEVGRKLFIVEVEAPKSDRPDRAPPSSNLRLERTIDVMDTKLIKVLLVEGSARYEYRFLKALLERESPDEKKNKSLDLRVVLLDADPDFAAQDKTALSDFPATREELEQYDVIIVGDIDPRHAKLGEKRLRNLADFVRGEDAKGRKTGKSGGGILFLAGSAYNPHAFKGTPLAEVLPVEPSAKAPAEAEERIDRYRFELTPVGRLHPIFRLSPDETENQVVWNKLAPLHWWAHGYRIRPLAEVLAVHPTQKALVAEQGQDPRHPLVVQQFVGSGRTMFFGFDETWRWRFREDEARYNKFWVQSIRYLSRGRLTRTDLRLDRQTPYRVGEPIKVTVRFPDNTPAPGQDPKGGPPPEVKVIAEYRPNTKDAPAEPEIQTMSLAKLEGSWATFEALLTRTREGKYRFWLSSPDVSKTQPGGEKPSAEATVELPPGELEKLRLNVAELSQAAEATQGGFYTLATADKLLEELPSGFRVSLSSPRPPLVLWNHVLCFVLVLGLLTAEWILRKRKHLL